MTTATDAFRTAEEAVKTARLAPFALDKTVAAARDWLGEGGLYLVAMLSGLTDVDAITLSTGRLVGQFQLEASTGWRLVLTAAIANLAFKAGATAILGDRGLFLRVFAAFGLASGGGLLLILFWPN